ncbi:MAG: Uma2 family endonuclease [Myxococcota bacterium]
MSLASRPARYRLSASELDRMCAAGLLVDARVELIDGELLEMNAQGPIHAGLTVMIHRLLEETYGAGHYVRDHSPLHLTEHDQPEPDLALIRGTPTVEAHPRGADAVLVVEIAVSTVFHDRDKADVYARGGVPAYFLINVEMAEVEVYRAPRVDGTYGEKRVFVAGERIEWPERDDEVDAGELLP